MKIRLILAVVILQILVLAYMGGEREWISRTGQPITLRTAPIDPTDPMRGAFVRLDYEISTVPAELCQGAVKDWFKNKDYLARRNRRDQIVYAVLKVNEFGIADLVALRDTAPTSGLFLRGRVQNVTDHFIRVRYGVEALFMSQAAAKKLENEARDQKAGAPINTRIAVGTSGIGVLKGYDWEPLGLTIAFDRPEQASRRTNTPRQPNPLTGLTVTLHNYSEHDLAIVSPADLRTFRMIPNDRFSGSTHYEWVRAKVAPLNDALLEPADVIIIKPGKKHTTHLDLTQAAWWVIDAKKPNTAAMPLSAVRDGWSASFRIEYAPPTEDKSRHLPHAELIRHTPIRSQAFNANQGMD